MNAGDAFLEDDADYDLMNINTATEEELMTLPSINRKTVCLLMIFIQDLHEALCSIVHIQT